MAEHHALLDIHHEVIAPPPIPHLPSYAEKTEVTNFQPIAVGQFSAHKVSDVLGTRYPFPKSAHYDYTEATTAYGRNAVSKTLQVLSQLSSGEEGQEGQNDERVTLVKRANVTKLLEALYDHTVIGDSLAGEKGNENVALLKELLSDADADVRKGAAQALGRFAILIQGRKAICDSGCAESLAFMLEDLDSADVRLAAGKTLLVLTQSIDGWNPTVVHITFAIPGTHVGCDTSRRDEVADNVSEGKVAFPLLCFASSIRCLILTSGVPLTGRGQDGPSTTRDLGGSMRPTILQNRSELSGTDSCCTFLSARFDRQSQRLALLKSCSQLSRISSKRKRPLNSRSRCHTDPPTCTLAIHLEWSPMFHQRLVDRSRTCVALGNEAG